MIKTGDHVRFLNSVGGGTVTRVDEKKGLVYVEDEDGFEIPATIRECVVIESVNEKTNFPLKDFSSSSKKENKTITSSESTEIVENKPLARTLYKIVPLDGMIPAELYVAVAEVLAYVYKKNNRR